jgi:drug/metabolite transporter (DMT)-like permease
MTRLSARSIAMLLLPPLLWAGNTVVARMSVGSISPLLLNASRWLLAFVILLPLGWRVLRPTGGLRTHWSYFAWLGLLGVGSFNALQYLALQTSTPINITLIAASMPVWMLAVGALRYGEKARFSQVMGALLSLAGVLVILARGQWATLVRIQLVPGDVFILAAAVMWAFYSWMLARPSDPSTREWPWTEFLLAQIASGAAWASVSAGGEWLAGHARIEWNGWVVALLLYVAVGPSLIAYRCWGIGVATAGPAMAAFFNNLTPVFTALLSAALLSDPPQWFHALAFALIVAGIIASSRGTERRG